MGFFENCAAAVIFVHKVQCRPSAGRKQQGSRGLCGVKWLLYLLHHLYRRRSWSGERQRRSPRWKCRLGQLATTEHNNDKRQADKHGGETVSDQDKRCGDKNEQETKNERWRRRRERSERARYWLRDAGVSCRTAQLARFREKHLKVWAFTSDTHTSAGNVSAGLLLVHHFLTIREHPRYFTTSLQDTDLTARLTESCAVLQTGTAHDSLVCVSHASLAQTKRENATYARVIDR